MTASASRPPNFTFPPHGRRDLPIQTASIFLLPDVGESLPARQPYLFHPTAGETYPSRLRVFSSCRMSARASRPPNVPFRLHLSNTASLDLPSDIGESLPDKQPYLFKPLARRGLPIRHGDYLTHRRTSARASRTDKLTFSILQPVRPTQPCCRLTARPSDHLTLPFCLNLSDSVSPDLQTDAGESTPGQTILSFQVLCSTRLTRPTRRLLKPPSDVGGSLPASQTHLFHLLAPQYRTPSNATYPIVQAILAFSPPLVRFNHPTREY